MRPAGRSDHQSEPSDDRRDPGPHRRRAGHHRRRDRGVARRTTATRSGGSRRAAPTRSTGPWRPPAPACWPPAATSRSRRPSGPRCSTAPRSLLDERARAVRPHHRRGGGQADPHGPRRGRAGRSTRSASARPRPARSPATWSPSTPARRAPGKLGFTLRVPIGVVGAISPFNFPLNLVAHKVAPAIAAGCPVVLKPASQTPLSALALADLLLDECGLPAGLAQRRHRVGPGGGRPARRPPRRRHDHLHRVARRRLGHPGPGAPQEGQPRAGQQHAR